MTANQEFISSLSPYLFWDVERDTVDPEQHASFLICRVMERGSSMDVRLTWDHYGSQQICEALMLAPSLTRKTIRFFANQFRIPETSFRAHQRNNNWAS